MKNEIVSLNSITFAKRENLSMVMLFLLFHSSHEACVIHIPCEVSNLDAHG